MRVNHGVIADASLPSLLAIREIPAPEPLPSEAVVRVAAFSLNRGEVRRSRNPPPNWRPGWDIAGVVECAAANGAGPQVGERVVGLMQSGGWAESVAASVSQLAVLPDSVTFAQASTLPVAGLTALHCLMKGGFLMGRTVLITGATGGVGDFAIQLAKLAGAKAVAVIRRPEQEAQVREAGADAVVIGEDLTEAKKHGPFALMIDSVGGKTLGSALGIMNPECHVVCIGTSSGNEVTFDASRFYSTGRATLHGMMLFDELVKVEAASMGLARLAGLVAQGSLKPRISLEANWSQVAETAQSLMDRTYPGKAVLHIT